MRVRGGEGGRGGRVLAVCVAVLMFFYITLQYRKYPYITTKNKNEIKNKKYNSNNNNTYNNNITINKMKSTQMIISNPIMFRSNVRNHFYNKIQEYFYEQHTETAGAEGGEGGEGVVAVLIEQPQPPHTPVIWGQLPNSILEKMASNIEISIFNHAIQEATFHKIIKKWENPPFVQLYHNRMRSVHFNLSAKIVLLFYNGEITMEQFAKMTHQEWNPEQWKERIENKIKKDSLKYNNTMVASTDLYKCSKCKSTKCTFYELQTRSADEPSTIFVTCLNCGKNWKC